MQLQANEHTAMRTGHWQMAGGLPSWQHALKPASAVDRLSHAVRLGEPGRLIGAHTQPAAPRRGTVA